MEASDLAVVARVKAGDHDAFRHLVERHSRSVFRLAYRLTGQEQDAEDVVQETFLRAFREIRRFEARSSFATWLYRITVNCAHDLLRQRPRAGSRPSLDDPDLRVAADLADSSASADPLRELASRRIDQRVRSAMGALSDQERSAFVMRHFEGLSIEEIGRVLDLKTSAAKHSVFRAVHKLRRALEPVAELPR
jgi:RNA polymerase sigma-70 factor (ECF subfamily)